MSDRPEVGRWTRFVCRVLGHKVWKVEGDGRHARISAYRWDLDIERQRMIYYCDRCGEKMPPVNR